MNDNVQPQAPATPGGGNAVLLVISWVWVGGPLVWGVLTTVQKSLALFH